MTGHRSNCERPARITPPGPSDCRACRRDAALAVVVAADTSLDPGQIVAAFDVAITTGAALRSLTAALAADPAALAVGAPAVVGRLVADLVARGSTTFALPACAGCGRTDRALEVTDVGGLCRRCAHRHRATACSHCQVVKPVAGRTADGLPICETCRRRLRGQRACGLCSRVGPIAVTGRDGHPDVCARCYRLPDAQSSRCGRRRPCHFSDSSTPICRTCSPRGTARCAHCHRDRPPGVRWPEGPVCMPCYDATLRRRGVCIGCHTARRLIDPPGPTATRCCDCAGMASLGHVCVDCGIEDKLFAAGRCDRCALARRTTDLLGDDTGQLPDPLFELAAEIAATPNPRTALNWLRNGAAAAILTQVATGQLDLSHDALDAHPQRQAADYLRRMLVANHILDERDEDLARTQRFTDQLLADIAEGHDRQLIDAYARWHVLRRLRRRAEANPGPRTPTHHVRNHLKAAVGLLDWLAQRDTTLGDASQTDIDAWLTTEPSAYQARDFVRWAADAGHCPPVTIPTVVNPTGTALHPDVRWHILSRLLNDDTLALTDRVAGCLVLLYGQQLSRIAIITIDQIDRHDSGLTLRIGADPITVPDPLAELITTLIDTGRTHIGVGSPATSRWLFPGHNPGQPLTAAHLGVRLRRLGIASRAARRATLIDLAAQLPAAVLAELLGISNSAAVHWVNHAGGDWSRYAAHLAHERSHP